jgi:hypothetical protein
MRLQDYGFCKKNMASVLTDAAKLGQTVQRSSNLRARPLLVESNTRRE